MTNILLHHWAFYGYLGCVLVALAGSVWEWWVERLSTAQPSKRREMKGDKAPLFAGPRERRTAA